MDDPYLNIQISTQIKLTPIQLNSSDIYNEIKSELIKNYEKKCNKHGYIDKIYKIDKYSNGHIIGEDFTGDIKIDVTYTCKICYPKIESIIHCSVYKINRSFITAKYGPIIFIIEFNNINKEKFKLNQNKDLILLENSNKIMINDTIAVKILQVDFNTNDNEIIAIGYLENYIK